MDHSKQSIIHRTIDPYTQKKPYLDPSSVEDRSTKARVLLRTYPLNVAVARVGMDCAVSIFLLGA